VGATDTATADTSARRTRRLGVEAGHEHYKWWALSCTSLGMLLATTNSGTLIIALPDLERELGTSLLALVWVILAYMIASTVLVLTCGRLSDLFGRKRAYVAGFVVFALASLGAGFAADGTQLILWRILQGVGAAFLFANASALVTDAFPREQLGVAMGTNVMVAAVGLVIGPVLGGALVAINWQWVFWFNVPLALAGSLWGGLILHELARPDSVRGFDPLGTLTFVAGLTGLVLGISRGGLSGWDDPVVIVSLVAAVILLPLFVLISSPLAGAWADRRGSRTLAALGMLVTAVGLAGMTLLEADSAYGLAAVWMFVVGIGSGMFNSPNTAAMMGTVPPHRRGIAAGARMMLQNTGAILSIAFVLAVITAAVPRDVLFKIFSGLAAGLTPQQLAPFIANMHTALWVLAAVSVLGALVSLLRPRQGTSA
jgi:MFS family permease